MTGSVTRIVSLLLDETDRGDMRHDRVYRLQGDLRRAHDALIRALDVQRADPRSARSWNVSSLRSAWVSLQYEMITADPARISRALHRYAYVLMSIDDD